MTKQVLKQAPGDMDSVWRDISDTWDRISGENDTPASPFALTREIAVAGHFTEDMVERIYARYDFCEGYSNDELAALQCLALAIKANAEKMPDEILKLAQTLGDQISRGQQGNGPTNGAGAPPMQEDLLWRGFSHTAKTTWPKKHQNLVFGPQFSYPLSARFDDGTWYRHGSNTPLQGVTKYMHVPAPGDWG